MSLFNYILIPVEECRFPVSEGGHKNIAWFWLTDSYYYIQLDDVKLFESSKEWQEKYPADFPYDEYPYIRQLEDLFDILPQIAAGITEIAYRFINTIGNWEWLMREVKQWYEVLGDNATDEQEALYDDLNRFLYHSNLDTGYLRFKSMLFFHHVGDRIIICYDFIDKDENDIPVWSAKRGSTEMTWIEFLSEIEDLLNRFFTDMDKQVEDAISSLMNHDYYKGLNVSDSRTGIKTDSVNSLRKEHIQREAYFYDILNKVKNGGYQPYINSEKILKQIEFVRKELLSKILDKPRIQVDYNEMIEDDLILLSREDTKTDSASNEISFYEGMPVGIYSDDNIDENDRIDCIVSDGIAIETPSEWQKNYSQVKWCCRITGRIRFISDIININKINNNEYNRFL